MPRMMHTIKGYSSQHLLQRRFWAMDFFFPSARSNATLVLCEYIPFRVVSIRDAYSADSRLSGSRMSSQRKLARRVQKERKGKRLQNSASSVFGRQQPQEQWQQSKMCSRRSARLSHSLCSHTRQRSLDGGDQRNTFLRCMRTS